MARDVAYQVPNGTDRTRQALRGGGEQNEIDAPRCPTGRPEHGAQTETASSDARASPGEGAPSDAIASESENAPASTDSLQEPKD